MMMGRLVSVVILALAGAGAGAQVPMRYAAAQLACARFSEQIETEIHGVAGGRPREDTGGRRGVWLVRAAALGDSGMSIEAWFDSLSIWRRSDGVSRSPDTDGLIGGRYRGGLSPLGTYTPHITPFIPDEIGEFADLRGAFTDLFPQLPARPLRPGETWNDAGGLSIERLGDSAAAAIQRYRLERKAVRRDSLTASDTTVIPVKQTWAETGEFSWDVERGLLRRTRRITVDTDVPAANGLRYPVRSRIVQRIVFARLADGPAGCE